MSLQERLVVLGWCTAAIVIVLVANDLGRAFDRRLSDFWRRREDGQPISVATKVILSAPVCLVSAVFVVIPFGESRWTGSRLLGIPVPWLIGAAAGILLAFTLDAYWSRGSLAQTQPRTSFLFPVVFTVVSLIVWQLNRSGLIGVATVTALVGLATPVWFDMAFRGLYALWTGRILGAPETDTA